MYTRMIHQQVMRWMDDREVIIIKGARQTGKTTLLQQLFERDDNALILNCENPGVASILESFDFEAIRLLFGRHRIIALDEVQSIGSIGSLLKLVFDELPDYKLIITGSSSFELMDQVGEPLTGRNIKFTMYPLSLEEMKDTKGWLPVVNSLSSYLAFGTYPGVIDLEPAKREQKLVELAGDYLFKDILMYHQIKSPVLVRQLLKALAHQAGAEVSVNELSKLLGASRHIIETYLDILEKSYVIFSLSSFSKNIRNEIRKGRKYYFYDNGILNAVVGNLNPLQNRSDQGLLWENFCMSERLKFNMYHRTGVDMHFWRTYDQAEIDLVEVHPDEMVAFEFIWHERRLPRLPASFAESYPVKKLEVITPRNMQRLFEG